MTSSNFKAGAQAPGESLWGGLLEDPPMPPPPRLRKTQKKQEPVPETAGFAYWNGLGLDELSEKLNAASLAFETDRAAFIDSFVSGVDAESAVLLERLEETMGGNRPGYVQAVYDLYVKCLAEVKLKPERQRRVLKALEVWRKNSLALETSFFATQDTEPDYSGNYIEAHIDYAEKVLTFFPDIRMPVQLIVEECESEFEERYAPKRLLAMASEIDRRRKEGHVEPEQDPRDLRFFGVELEADRVAYNYLHSDGIVNVALLPNKLRVQDLNRVENDYVRADFLATAAVHRIAASAHNLSDEALYVFGLRPRRAGRRRQSRQTVRSSGRVTRSDGDDDADDDVFYDVLDEDEDEFFDAPEAPTAAISQEEGFSALSMLFKIHKTKESGRQARSPPSDLLTYILLRPETDVSAIVREAAQNTPEDVVAMVEDRVASMLPTAELQIETVLSETLFNAPKYRDQMRDILQRSCRLMIASFSQDISKVVGEDDAGDVRDEIARYLAVNARARVAMMARVIRGMLDVHVFDDDEDEPEEPVASSSPLRSGSGKGPKGKTRHRTKSIGSKPADPPVAAADDDDEPNAPDNINPDTKFVSDWIAELISAPRGYKTRSYVQIGGNLVGLLGGMFACVGMTYLIKTACAPSTDALINGIERSITDMVDVGSGAVSVSINVRNFENLVNLRKAQAKSQKDYEASYVKLAAKNLAEKTAGKKEIEDMLTTMSKLLEEVHNMFTTSLPAYMTSKLISSSSANARRLSDYIKARAALHSTLPTDQSDTQNASHGNVDLESNYICNVKSDVFNVLDKAFNATTTAWNPIDLNQTLDAVLTEKDVAKINQTIVGCGDTVFGLLFDQLTQERKERIAAMDKFYDTTRELAEGNVYFRKLLDQRQAATDDIQLESGATQANSTDLSVYGNSTLSKFALEKSRGLILELLNNETALGKVFDTSRDESEQNAFLARIIGDSREFRASFDEAVRNYEASSMRNIKMFLKNMYFMRTQENIDGRASEFVASKRIFEKVFRHYEVVFLNGRTPLAAFDVLDNDHLKRLAVNESMAGLISSTNALHAETNSDQYFPTKPEIAAIDEFLLSFSEDSAKNWSETDAENAMGDIALKNKADSKILKLFAGDFHACYASVGVYKDDNGSPVAFYAKPVDVSKMNQTQFGTTILRCSRTVAVREAVYHSKEKAKTEDIRASDLTIKQAESNVVTSTLLAAGHLKRTLNEGSRLFDALLSLFGLGGAAIAAMQHAAHSSDSTGAQRPHTPEEDEPQFVGEGAESLGRTYIDAMGICRDHASRLATGGLGYSARLIEQNRLFRSNDWAGLFKSIVFESDKKTRADYDAQREEERVASLRKSTSQVLMEWALKNKLLLTSSAASVIMGTYWFFGMQAVELPYRVVAGIATAGQSEAIYAASTLIDTFTFLLPWNLATWNASALGDAAGLPQVAWEYLKYGGTLLGSGIAEVVAGVYAYGWYRDTESEGPLALLKSILFTALRFVTSPDTLVVSTTFAIYMVTGNVDLIHQGALMIFQTTLASLSSMAVTFIANTAFARYVEPKNFDAFRRDIDKLFGQEDSDEIIVTNTGTLNLLKIHGRGLSDAEEIELYEYTASQLQDIYKIKELDRGAVAMQLRTLVRKHIAVRQRWIVAFSVTKALAHMATMGLLFRFAGDMFKAAAPDTLVEGEKPSAAFYEDPVKMATQPFLDQSEKYKQMLSLLNVTTTEDVS